MIIHNRLITADFDTVWEIDHEGDLYPSEVFAGRVWHIEAGTGGKRLLATLDSAADLILDGKNQELIVPDTRAGKLVFMLVGG